MLSRYLPKAVQKTLFGDRDRYGRSPIGYDSDWDKWQKQYAQIHEDVQKGGAIGAYVNNAGYSVLKSVNFENQVVAELGPGAARHTRYFQGKPKEYHAIDSCPDFFPALRSRFDALGVNPSCHLIEKKAAFPLLSSSVDVFLSFYSLEHVDPLKEWVQEIFRVLKPGGKLIGAIPTEGGFVWGFGRFLTSRRIYQSKYGVDIDKIVCWEHPNFCDEIISELKCFGEIQTENWPAKRFPYDLTLLTKFSVQKAG